MVFEEIISAGIVSIVVLTLFVTLPAEAPLKKLLSKHAISKMFYYYATFYLTFAVILLLWTIANWGWKSVSFQSYKIIQKLEKRITKLLLLVVICIPCRYILRLMIIPPNKMNKNGINGNKLQTIDEIKKSPHKRQRHKSVPFLNFNASKSSKYDDKDNNIKIRDSIDIQDIKDAIFGSSNNKLHSDKKQIMRINKITPFQELENKSTLNNVSLWSPLPVELFEIARLFQLFAKIRVHGQKNIPRNKPCLIIVNHALGHGFDVPMIVYVLRKYCNLSHVRVLVSPEHFNYPIWCDMVYYLGGVPRTRSVVEHVMKSGENIIMFAAKKKKQSMIWDNRRHLYLDLVHKYDYCLVPAVCVSDDDVIEMVYNIREPSDRSGKNNKSRPSQDQLQRQPSNQSQYDTDTDNEEEEKTQFRSFKTIHGRLRHGYRKQYHLRFSEPIDIPKGERKSRKRRKSAEYKMDEDDGFDSLNSTPKSKESSPSKMEVRFSGLEFKHRFKDFDRSISPSTSVEDIDKYKDDDSIESNNNIVYGHKRKWSHELEVGLKNAVEDAMTDGITDMYNKLKSDPSSSLLKTMQKKMRSVSTAPEYQASLRQDIRSNSSNDLPAKGTWVD